ncbi:hypothetical protein [Vagococcus fluvialis]|uniref:hypothetical protein n=1 Tax=Vagococcus fluvialis TaxID=2738 RepID=UPI001D0B7CBB|nr:hypothetical protein [Vagococcus fluvialis]UDM70701.1 hypothetical protein K5L00_11300 [Vagococcus fluvialis]UDM78120.1 hypothetical protein K5K98_06835 [Vagococcus fluvialis]UDM82389.1 hypothetical protein K5K96_13775 [Vagococcus fluvialis]
MANYNKNQNDFEQEFQMNLQSLQLSCDNYDNGKEFAVIEMATRLRVLLNDKGRNISLFQHLGLKNINFVNTAFEIDEDNILDDSCLVYISPDENFEFMKYYPFLDRAEKNLIPFEEWWNQTVYRDSEKRFTRADIILHIADKEGGAHSDEKISDNYYNFSRRGNGATTFYSINGNQSGESKYMDNLHYASLRQIAYEVLESLKLI